MSRESVAYSIDMSENKIEFKWLDAKCVGSDTVVFKLEDNASVKIKIDIDRAGIAVGIINPDGTPHYEIGTAVKVTVIPPKKSYFIPKSKLKTSSVKQPEDLPFIR